MSSNLSIYQNEKDYEFNAKAIFVGPSAVGKSSIIEKFTQDKFDPSRIAPTVGLSFVPTFLTINNHKMKLDFWDTAGQQRYKTITTSFYRKSNGIIFVFDLTLKQSFQVLNDWIKQALEASQQNIVKILVGNKSDMIFNRQVSKQQAENLARDKGMIYYETSALDGENITELFQKMGEQILLKFQEDPLEFKIIDNRRPIIKLRPDKLQSKRHKNCRC